MPARVFRAELGEQRGLVLEVLVDPDLGAGRVAQATRARCAQKPNRMGVFPDEESQP
jgi:hypothetical protein